MTSTGHMTTTDTSTAATSSRPPMRTPLSLRALPDALPMPGSGTGDRSAGFPATPRPHAKELTGMTPGTNPGKGSGEWPSAESGGRSAVPHYAYAALNERPPATGHTIVDCPCCGRLVPPATDHDRVTDVCGPHPPGWRLCWCGHAWIPLSAPTRPPLTAETVMPAAKRSTCVEELRHG